MIIREEATRMLRGEGYFSGASVDAAVAADEARDAVAAAMDAWAAGDGPSTVGDALLTWTPMRSEGDAEELVRDIADAEGWEEGDTEALVAQLRAGGHL